MLLKGCSTLAMVLTCVGMSTAPAKADVLRHIDEVAVAVRNDAARIANEVRYHFRGSVHYEHLYRDAYEMYRRADHIHAVAHHSNNLHHLRSDAAELDELFHHLEDLVAELNVGHNPHGGYRHGVGYGYGVGYGHSVHAVGGSYHINRLQRLMSTMSENLHHLQEDIDSIVGPAPVPYNQAAPYRQVVPAPAIQGPLVPGPVYQEPGYQGPVLQGPGAARIEFGKGKNRFGITLGIR